MQFLLTRSFDAYIVLTCTEADVNIHVPPISISSAAIFLYSFHFDTRKKCWVEKYIH